MTKKPTFDLMLKERRFTDRTLLTYHYKNSEKVEKKFTPIDIDGCRYRLNKETGEITYYPRDICEKSRAASVRKSRILFSQLLEMNNFDWFATFTFDNAIIDRSNAKEVYSAFQKYLKSLHRKFSWVRYVVVPERHKKDGCYHFHACIGGLNEKELGLVRTGKVCCHWSTKNGVCSEEFYNKTKSDHNLQDTDGVPIYNVTTFPYGYTTVSRIQSKERCNSYVKKYINKNFGSTEVFKKRFFYSENLDVPEIVDRLIGSGFHRPKNIESLHVVSNSAIYKFSESKHYDDNHNVLQIWVDNENKEYLEKGLIPVELLQGQVYIQEV